MLTINGAWSFINFILEDRMIPNKDCGNAYTSPKILAFPTISPPRRLHYYFLEFWRIFHDFLLCNLASTHTHTYLEVFQVRTCRTRRITCVLRSDRMRLHTFHWCQSSYLDPELWHSERVWTTGLCYTWSDGSIWTCSFSKCCNV